MASASVFVNNVQIYFVKCDPARPSTKLNPNDPQWECQIRTTDPAQNADWESIGLRPKFVIPKGGTPADGYYRVNLNKRAFKKDKSPAVPIEVVSGDLRPLNPNHIGNGSTANLRLLARDAIDARTNQPTKYFSLAGIQVTRLLKYTPQNVGFGQTGFESDEDPDADDQGPAFAPDNAAQAGAPVQFAPPTQVNPGRSPTSF